MTRPKWYDDQVVAYSGLIRKKAKKYYKSMDVDEVHQIVSLYAFEHWKYYNETYGFERWIRHCFKNAIDEEFQKRKTQKRTPRHFTERESYLPNQQSITELNEALRNIPDTRNGQILLMSAYYDNMKEAGDEFGISRERTRQIVDAERAKLIERMEKTKNVAVEG